MDEPWKHHAKWKKAGHQRPHVFWFHLCESSRISKCRADRKQCTTGCQGLGCGEKGEWLLMCMAFLFGLLGWVIVTYLCECTKKKIELYNLKGLVYGIWNISHEAAFENVEIMV